MTTFSSPLPRGVRLTSPFGLRWGTLHAGTDFGPPEPGQSGVPVFAVADGKVADTGRGDGSASSDVAPYHSGRAVLIDHGTIGGDRMKTYYGHLESYSVRPGDRVKAGEQIGVMGGSGPSGDHDFAIHLHIGVMQNATRPISAATYYGEPGWIDSHAWLRSKGIDVGGDAPVDPGKTSAAAGSSGGSSSGSSNGRPDDVVDAAELHRRFDRMGYGDSKWPGPRTELYQDAQLYGDLVVDRHWGDVTEAHYQWTRDLQAAMNQWKGSDIRVDGDCRKVTIGRVREVQERNHGGAYQGAVDGVPGRITCQMLGIPTHPNL